MPKVTDVTRARFRSRAVIDGRDNPDSVFTAAANERTLRKNYLHLSHFKLKNAIITENPAEEVPILQRRLGRLDAFCRDGVVAPAQRQTR